MDGRELFEKYTSLRDYTESGADRYAQLLQTVFGHIEEELYPILERAEAEGKRIGISHPFDGTGVCWDEISPDHVVLV